MPAVRSWSQRLLSEKSDAVALQHYDGAGSAIDREDIRQALTAVLSGFTAGRWLWSVRAWALTARLQNSKKRAERSERLMYEQSHRDYLRLLSASRLACCGYTANVITPLPAVSSATKMPENWSWRTRQLLTCRCVSVMLLRWMQKIRRS